MSYNLLVLFNLMIKIPLYHFNFVFMIVRLLTKFLLILAYQLIHTTLVAFFFVVKTLLKTQFFSFK